LGDMNGIRPVKLLL